LVTFIVKHRRCTVWKT